MDGTHIILQNPEGKFLLQLRDENPDIFYPGYWGLIGGALEQREAPEDGIKREIEEEICCKIFNMQYVTRISIEINAKNYTGTFFKGVIKEDVKDINLTEGQKVQYFTFEELKELHIVPIFKKLLLGKKWK